jgi:hypothetical protein
MAHPPSLDKVTIDSLTSRNSPQIAAGLEQAQAIGWDLPQACRVLTEFLGPLFHAGYFYDWPDLDTAAVPGPRVECEATPVPLVSILERWPGVVPFLPWLPGPRPLFSLYGYVDLFHDLSEEELDELDRRGPVWERTLRTDDWAEASRALDEASGNILARYLRFDSFFEDSRPVVAKALLAQAAEDGTFLIGKQLEFEGNHNDAEYAVLMVRLTEPPPRKSSRRRS